MNYYILHKFIGLFFILGLFTNVSLSFYLISIFGLAVFYKKINSVFYKVIVFFMLGTVRNYFLHQETYSQDEYTLKKTSFKAKIKDIKTINENTYLTIYDIAEYDFQSSKHIIERYVNLPSTAIIKIKHNIKNIAVKNITIDSEIIAVGRFYPVNGEVLLEKKTSNKIKGIVYDFEIIRNAKLTFKDKLRIKISSLSNNAQQLCLAMFLGDTFAVKDEMRQDFNTVGLAHVLGVSILNIGVLFYALYSFILFLLRNFFIKLSNHLPLKYVAQMLSLIMVIFYCYVIGFDYPLMRSLLISGFNLLSLFIGKKRKKETLFITAACVMCFFKDSIYDIGFQLSFLSVLIIYSFSYKIYNKILSDIYLTLTTTIGTAPIIIYNFHTICMQPILGNLIIIPFFSFIIIPIVNFWIFLSFFNLEYFLSPIVNFVFFILIKTVTALKCFSFLQHFPLICYQIILLYVFFLCLYSIFQNIYLYLTGYVLVILNMIYSHYQQDFIIVSSMGVALVKKDKIYLNNSNVFFGSILNQAYNKQIVFNDYRFFDRDGQNIVIDNKIQLIFNYQKNQKYNLKTYNIYNLKTQKIYIKD